MLLLGAGQGLRQVGKVLLQGKKNGPFQFEPLDQRDLKGHHPRHVGGVAGDLAVSLKGVHIPHVHPAPRNLHRADQHRPGPDGIHVHMAVRAGRELLRRLRELVGSPHQKAAEVTGVVRVGKGKGRRRSKLAEEGAHPGRHAHEVRGREGQNGVLNGMVRLRRKPLGVPGDLLRPLFVQRHGEAPLVIEDDRVAVREGEGGDLRAAGGAPHRPLADPLEDRLGVIGPTGGALLRHVGVAPEAARIRRSIVPRGGRHGGHRQRFDPDGDGVTDLGPLHRHGDSHLVPPLQLRGDHGPPAPRRGVRHDEPAVPHRSQHGLRGVEHPVSEAVDKNCS